MVAHGLSDLCRLRVDKRDGQSDLFRSRTDSKHAPCRDYPLHRLPPLPAARLAEIAKLEAPFRFDSPRKLVLPLLGKSRKRLDLMADTTALYALRFPDGS